MNIKNFEKYKDEISKLPQIQNKLNLSNEDFKKFKESVVIGYDQNKTPILSKDLDIDNRYLNYMTSMGYKKFNSLLYNIFSTHYGLKTKKEKVKSGTINCDPSNFEILGPLTAKDEKTLRNYYVNQKGGKVYRIKLPEECTSQMTSDERRIYVRVEPKENRIHFHEGVPERLRGKKLGTLIYLKMIQKLGYITSSMANSAEIKMVYEDLLTNPKYENDLMSLLLQKQVLIFDRNTKLDVKKIFNEFVLNKFTDKKSVKISPALKEKLGEDFTNWYNSLEQNPEDSIEDKINKYKGKEPKEGDTVVDTTTNKIYYLDHEYKDKEGKGEIRLSSDKFKTLLLPREEKKRFKVIHRA
jgi:hypothetical protein